MTNKMKNNLNLFTILFFTLFSMNCVKGQIVSFTAQNDTFYPGDTLHLLNTSTGFISGTLFTWEFNDGECDTLPYRECIKYTTGLDSVDHVFLRPTIYSIRLSATDQYSNVIDSTLSFVLLANSVYRNGPPLICQEIVSNGSFELHTLAGSGYCSTTPIGPFDLNNIDDWVGSIPSNAICAAGYDYTNVATPDCFNDCIHHLTAGCIPCNTYGNEDINLASSIVSNHSYAGLFTRSNTSGRCVNSNRREYLMQTFYGSSALAASQSYIVCFWVSLGESSNRATNIGAAFSDGPPCPSEPNPFCTENYSPVLVTNPVNSTEIVMNNTGWVPVFGRYVATGNENTIVIGNFDLTETSTNTICLNSGCTALGSGCTSSHSGHASRNINYNTTNTLAYYFIDDVSLNPQAGTIPIEAHVTTPCSASSWELTVPNATDFNRIVWSTGEETASITVSGLVSGESRQIRVLGFDAGGCAFYGEITLSGDNFMTIGASSDLTICPGESITLNASGSTNCTWSPIVGTQPGCEYTVSPNTTQTYTVTGDCGGSTSATTSITVNVEVVTGHMSISPTANSFCPGSPVQISLRAYGSSSTYTWSPSTNLNATNVATVLFTTSSVSSNATYTVNGFSGDCPISTTVTLNYYNTCGNLQPCENCIPSFSPLKEKEYMISAWVKEENDELLSYSHPYIEITYESSGATETFYPEGGLIDRWQRIENEFTVPNAASKIFKKLKNSGTDDVFFDDVRVFPKHGEMKSFVYDPVTLRFVAELDENNYATFYEYDEQGNLVRIKKETERGIMTINENRISLPKE